MKNYAKILILLIVLLMLLQSTVFSAFAFTPIDISAGTHQAGTGYTSASQVKYNKSSEGYLYNWGARGEDATFLTTYALSFYTGSYAYDVLSELSGATTESKVPSSSLYKQLSSLMSSKHSYQTSYNATRPMFQYTDCQNGGGKISSFYSGQLIGPSWDGGSTWNREHTWPNSKGDASGNGENDIMMLRPASVSENSSRGNKAYGEASGYYNPNDESNGQYDLRGDVARIVLYTYVRWKCTNTGTYNPNGIFGTGGVIQSIDILLEWIEEDPVDTWELGRNDSVQSITGTRNVFVDYPEYAFILFGREIPSDMTTPSGEAKSDACTWDSGKVTKEATCTTTGIITYTCTVSGCGKTKTETIAALGHSWDNGKVTTDATCDKAGVKTFTCLTCNTTKTSSISATGHSWNSGEITTNPTCTTAGVTTVTCIICSTTKTSSVAATGHSWGDWTTTTEPTCTTDGLKTQTCNNDPSHTQTQILTALGHAWGNWVTTLEPTCKTEGKKTITCANDPSHVETQSIPTTDHTWSDWITDTEPTETSDGTKHRVCSGCNTTESGVIPSPGHVHSYSSSVTAPTCTEQGYTTHTCGCGDSYKDTYVNKLGHKYFSTTTAPTCSSQGYTTHICFTCGNSYTDSYVDKLAHSYSDGSCSTCGAADPSYDTNAKDNFIQTVASLKDLKGQNLYNGICDALEIYESLSSKDKQAVSNEYNELKTVVKNYNNDVASVNSSSDMIASRIVGITVTLSSLSLALYGLLGKKFI